MEEIRLGTIGSGFIVHRILGHVRETEGIRLAAVYSRSRETGAALAAEYGAQRSYTDLDALLQDQEVNFVYVASPNLLHYGQAKKALLAGKNVICEKPFCTRADHARELMEIAKERGLFLIDAVPTAFLPNFEILKTALPRIGRVKLVMANFSQYSSRYDLVLRGEKPNIFNPAMGGGCLMDINFYNLYLNVALFGKPAEAAYYPNLHEGLADTSGVLVMRYDGFVSQSAGAKDAWGINYFQVEGEGGYLYVADGSACLSQVTVATKTSEECLNGQDGPDRWAYEVREIVRMAQQEDYGRAYGLLELTQDVMETLERARRGAGIVFPGDAQVNDAQCDQGGRGE